MAEAHFIPEFVPLVTNGIMILRIVEDQRQVFLGKESVYSWGPEAIILRKREKVVSCANKKEIQFNDVF